MEDIIPQAHKPRKNTNIFWAIIIGSLIVGSSIIYAMSFNKNYGNEGYVDPDTIFSGRELKQDEFLLGNKNRKVILLQYSDLECPYCKKFNIEVMPAIYTKYKNDIGVAYRHFPLSIHAKAGKEAEGALCARAQGGSEAYKNYLDKVFLETQGNDSLDFKLLPKYISEIGLDPVKWGNCFATSTYAAQVEADLNDGIENGIQGTPNTLVLIKQDNYYKILTNINGARDEKYVTRVIDQAIKLAK